LIGLLPFPLDLRGHLWRLGEDFVDVHQLVELLVTEHMKLGDDDIQQERERELERESCQDSTRLYSSSLVRLGHLQSSATHSTPQQALKV
jgi:hypothetical protein